MSILKLKGSTSGYVELTAPATAGNNTITLPTTAGTVAVKDASNNTEVGTGVTIGSPSSNTFTVSTNGSERIRVDSSGRLGIGTASPIYTNHIKQNTTYGFGLESNADDSRFIIGNVSSTWRVAATYGSTGSFQPITFFTSDLERARIDNSGRLLIGTSSARSFQGLTNQIQIESPDGATQSLSTNRNDIYGSFLSFVKSRSTSAGGVTAVQNGDQLGSVLFCGTDGSNVVIGARIDANVDGTPGTNDMPGRLVFSTTADGASSPTERMRIQSNGRVLIGKTTDGDQEGFSTGTYTYQVSNNTVCAYFNRLTSDGVLIQFRQDTIDEGSISVSGTTVSYNGAHLSRWSQLPSGADRTEILRGSLLSNLEEMCEWGDEDNEQLNRMKVSDVVGDKNVAGVFQAWDDDDDTYTNDFYCAMTGDFIIRIGSGVTVERGDLLMSAGDGTAKPQDDDIVRSKTVAKVTSTSVTCTYDDGSYCVPCVLMAC